MKLIILGASGFIGRNMVDYFAKKDEFNIIAVSKNRKESHNDYSNVAHINRDLRIPGALSEELKSADAVLQFAATTSGAKDIVERPYIHVTDNAVMNSYLLRESYEAGIKHFIFPSCTVMLGPGEGQKESEWDASKEIHKTYFGVGNTKVYIEKMCEFYSRLGLKCTAIRHSNVYGKHDKFDLERSHVLGATIRKVVNAKENSSIEVWGTGKARRDFLHIDDLCDFVYAALNNQKNSFDLFNCGCGYSTSINELVQMIIDVSGKKLEICNNLEKPDIPTALSLDCSKARDLLGWYPRKELSNGLLETYNWLEQQV